MATVKIDNYVSVNSSDDVARKFGVWLTIHEHGPYTIRMVPTGVNTAVKIKHEKTGHEFDLTDYDSI